MGSWAFLDELSWVEIPPKFCLVPLDTYEGSTNLAEYLKAFDGLMKM